MPNIVILAEDVIEMTVEMKHFILFTELTTGVEWVKLWTTKI